MLCLILKKTSSMTEHKLEPKENFHIEIKNYFLDLAGNLIPTDLLNRLIDKIYLDKFSCILSTSQDDHILPV